MHTYVYKIHNPLCIRLAFQHVDVLNIHACPKLSYQILLVV